MGSLFIMMIFSGCLVSFAGLNVTLCMVLICFVLAGHGRFSVKAQGFCDKAVALHPFKKSI